MGHFRSGRRLIAPILRRSFGSRAKQWPSALHQKGTAIVGQAHWSLERRQFSTQADGNSTWDVTHLDNYHVLFETVLTKKRGRS